MTMDKAMWSIVAGLSVALALLAAPASAAPAIGAGGMKAALPETSSVEKARWMRRCWRDRWGERRCRRAWVPDYGFAPSYGPGITLYFGGGGRRFRDHRGFRGDDFRGRGSRDSRGRGDR
jgi:hypothetical protein